MRAGPGPPDRRRWPLVATAGVYLLVSMAVHHRILARLSSATVGSVASDSAQFTWWLAWLPYAVGRGMNPLYTTWMNYPAGVNALWNTSVPGLAALFAPLTLSAGAVVSYNVAMILGPVVSGLALVGALRPYLERMLPRAVAGMLYGFSPFMIAHASVGHLNLVWAVLPPALVYAVSAIVVREQPHPLRAGSLLGVAFAAQTALYTQTVALGALALVVTGAVLAARWPRLALARVRQVSVAVAGCLGGYAVLCAYPLYLLVAGPNRPMVPIRRPGEYVTDLANLLVPTELTWWRSSSELAGQLRTHPGEQGGYLGAVLVVLILLTLVVVRHAPARVTAAVGALLLLLSLGPSVVILDRDTGIPGPWVLIAAVANHVEPMRLQVFVVMCAAMLVAFWVDRLATTRRGWVRAGGIALTVLAVVGWAPAGPRTSPVLVPTAFTGNALRRGDVVESYPPADGGWQTGGAALQWQLAAGMRYRLTSGYFIGSDAGHPLLLESPPSLFLLGARAATRDDPATPDARAAARELLAKDVTAVVVVPDRTGPPRLLSWAREVTGSPGVDAGGAWVFRLGNRPP